MKLLVDPGELASYEGWSREVYADLLALQEGRLAAGEFDARYLVTKAVLVLDVTGFTINAMHGGALTSFLRILDVQKVCLPVLRDGGAAYVRTFADDIVALFDAPELALDAALEMQRRVDEFPEASTAYADPPEICIGLGYGSLYAIGPNFAMGDEMNRASVLGEDVARGGEILITEGLHDAVAPRAALAFDRQTRDDTPFPYYRVERTS